MGCDIHSFAEAKQKSFWDHLLFRAGKWIKAENFLTLDDYDKKLRKKESGSEPFDWRSYAVFGFLAGVRNYSHSEPITERRGLPYDSEYLNETTEDAWGGLESRRSDLTEPGSYHSHSYLTLKELLEFDYEKKFWDRRVMKQEGPNCFTDPIGARIDRRLFLSRNPALNLAAFLSATL